jgi:L-amino acid N-acyltransferase YncA
MNIQDAQEGDFPALTTIYNEIILNSTAIYRENPVSLEDRLALWRGRLQQGYPTLVAREGDSVLGFSSFGDFRAAPGYRFTIEHTVHVLATRRGEGVGSELVKALMPRAAALGKHVMIGGIDGENTASLRFHERLGFEPVARFKEVGFKFGRFLDLVFVQRVI